MSYAELISRLRALPVEGRIQLFDFSELFEARFGLVAADLHAGSQWDDPGLFSEFEQAGFIGGEKLSKSMH